MEYCSGGEVHEYLKEIGKFSEEDCYSYASQLTEAVRYCHNSNVIHRDLKLENLLFQDGMKMRLKVCDFGIAGMFAHGT
jgi:serine/threonine protein kinase